jgi:aromatic-L-amino-acid/L-tryptophan decarboxylase
VPDTPLEPEQDLLRALIQQVAEEVAAQIGSLPRQPSWGNDAAGALVDAFREAAPEAGRPLEEILARLRPAFAASFNTAGPGYLAFIPGGGIPSAALADFLACATNRYVGVSMASPALARIETTAIDWLASMMGYPAGAGGILTSGGSISNLTAVVTARAALLPENFLPGVIYYSTETHLSVPKAARIAGFPERCLRPIAVDERYRLRPDALETAVRADRAHGLRPFMVIANVGTTNTGAVDPIPDLIDVARRHELWVHADAAYGGFFRIAPGGEALMPGIEACDSITIDPHKGLFLPYGTGCLLVRDPEPLLRAHRMSAEYLQDVPGTDGTTGFADLSPELSRDFRGLRVWLPIQLHGLAAFRGQLREKLDLARHAWEELRGVPFLEMLDEPQLSIVAFRFRGRRAGRGAGRSADAAGDAAADDRAGAELLRRVNARRRVFLSSTSIGGRYVLRICVLSFRTHLDRVRDAIEALKEEGAALARGAAVE